MFYTAAVRPARSGPRILYNTSLLNQVKFDTYVSDNYSFEFFQLTTWLGDLPDFEVLTDSTGQIWGVHYQLPGNLTPLLEQSP